MGVGVDLLCSVAIDIMLNTGLSYLLYRVFYGLFEGCVVEGVRVCLCCCSVLKEGLILCVPVSYTHLTLPTTPYV